MPVKSSIPMPMSVMPRVRIGPGPRRAERRAAKVDAMMIAPVIGRKHRPVSIGV